MIAVALTEDRPDNHLPAIHVQVEPLDILARWAVRGDLTIWLHDPQAWTPAEALCHVDPAHWATQFGRSQLAAGYIEHGRRGGGMLNRPRRCWLYVERRGLLAYKRAADMYREIAIKYDWSVDEVIDLGLDLLALQPADQSAPSADSTPQHTPAAVQRQTEQVEQSSTRGEAGSALKIEAAKNEVDAEPCSPPRKRSSTAIKRTFWIFYKNFCRKRGVRPNRKENAEHARHCGVRLLREEIRDRRRHHKDYWASTSRGGKDFDRQAFVDNLITAWRKSND